ncbi:MAG: hypothetical protein IK077_10520 [Thermoguttaceae bacterium]|nr:hypothetical protein [Thermoguttaceae bacterium]
MGMGFWILGGLMAIGALAFWHNMRLWSVTIVGFNIIFATLFAIGLFEMVANILDGFMAVTMFYNDMIAFAVIFVVVLAILMVATSSMSKVDLFFSDKTNAIGKWVVSVLVVLGFASITTFVFYEVMPEKPKASAKLPSMALIDFMSGGSLAPMIGDSKWSTDSFVQEQQKRDAAVYTQTLSDGNSGWKFDGDSPNAQ